MNIDRSSRCAMNIKYSEGSLQNCKEAGFSISSFDRNCEPKNAGSTMEWGTSEAIKQHGSVPDIIHDKGGIGKEPMIRIIGKNPKDVIDKMKVLRRCRNPLFLE
jgi:predicted fused transcriptional regulator/phosphomethylpyrimidine kinase